MAIRKVQLKAQIKPGDVERLTRGLPLAVNRAALRVAQSLADRAIRQLVTFDRRLGHDVLASLWAQRVVGSGGGGALVEVYNRARDMTFHNEVTSRDKGRHRTNRFPVSGARVLAILEGGARRHPIEAVNAEYLTVPFTHEVERTRAYRAQYGPHATTPPARGGYRRVGRDGRFPQRVDHPGVTGHGNLATVRRMLEVGVRAAGPELARRVQTELA